MATRKQLVRLGAEEVLVEHLEMADTFWKRLVGLQFRRELGCKEGLWLAPCSSLHTCFMRFPIDVIMLDRNHQVVQFRRNLRPWRALICPRATHSVVETCVGQIELQIGDRLHITGIADKSAARR